MTTEAVEALIVETLLADDSRPVDTRAGRNGIAVRRTRHVGRRRHREWVLAVAAVVLIAASTPLLTPRHDTRHTAASNKSAPVVLFSPTAPPSSVSPSGLPVGLLQASIAVTTGPGQGRYEFRLLVRADGTGQIKVYDFDYSGFDSFVDPFDVTLSLLAPGRVAAVYRGQTCLTLGFVINGAAVSIRGAHATGVCITSPETAAALTGLTIAVRPLPPSGRIG